MAQGPSASGLGRQARELAVHAGLTLNARQADTLDQMLAVRADGQWEHFESELISDQHESNAILECRILASFLLLDQRIIWSAHTRRAATEAFRRFQVLLSRLAEQDDSLRVRSSHFNGVESFELPDTGARMRFTSRTTSSSHRFSADLVIVDQTNASNRFDRCTLIPVVAASPNPQIVYSFS